jgi:hypothetical protein
MSEAQPMTLPFPLRPKFLAQVVIPRDLTRDEATRLCAFIQALASDPQRSNAEAADKT